MRLRQLSDLQGDVQRLADIQNATAMFPLADLTEYINQAWTRVYGLLARSGENYFLSGPAAFSTVSGQDTYYTTNGSGPSGTNVLPLDLWHVKGLDVQQQNGYWLNAHRFEFEERNDYQANQGLYVWPSRPLYDYRNMGNVACIKMIPVPAGTPVNCQLWYYPAAVRLVNPTDTIDGGNGWERMAVAIAARWCAVKDENYELLQVLDQEIAKWEAEIAAESMSRNTEEAPRVRRSRYQRRHNLGWPYGPGFGGL